MSDSTPRFGLPFIIPGQAQKELFHNEALLAVDALLHATVEDEATPSPPSVPTAGQCWIVPEGAGGAWADHEGSLAAWTANGWRFVVPLEGMTVWSRAANLPVRYANGLWVIGEICCSRLTIDGEQVVGPRQPAVASPSGGTIIDAEARACLDALIATLMSHGLTG
jgi:hypothetical protein